MDSTLRGRALEREKTPEAQTLLEATRKLEVAASELPAAVRLVVIKALKPVKDKQQRFIPVLYHSVKKRILV